MDGSSVLGLALALLLVAAPAVAVPTLSPTGDSPATGTGDVPPASALPAPAEDATRDRASTRALVAPPVETREDSSGYLALPSDLVRTATITTQTLDAGGAVAIDSTRLQSRYTRLRIAEAFQESSTDAGRRAAIAEGYEHIVARIDSLERRERTALERYNRGEISTRGYLRELAIVDAGARGLSPAIAQLYQYTQTVDDAPVNASEIAGLKARLLGMRGPVRGEVGDAIVGDTPPKRVYVSTSDTGVVLSTFVSTGIDLQYVREAYLPSNRRADAPDQYFTNGSHDFDRFEDRAMELYPWTFENELARSLVTRTGAPFLYRAGTYSVTVDHPHGTSRGGDLITYIDGGTTDVFREVQYLSPAAIVSDEPQTNSSDGVLVQVNRTYASGPLEIRVRDAETNEPVAATVAIDGEPVGETDTDGRLWTLTPRDPFVVNATTRNTTVSVPITFPSDQFPG